MRSFNLFAKTNKGEVKLRYYISDCHFFHGEMNEKMDKRGFVSEEEMNSYMMEQWNGRVRKKDEVVVLGDFSFGTAQQTNDLIDQLNGKIYLIRGNHDRFLQDKEFDDSRFMFVRHYAELHDNRRKVILSHYPVTCYNGQYRRSQKGEPLTYMLYGHVHNTFDEELMLRYIHMVRESKRPLFGSDEPQNIPCHMLNCFCGFCDYIPQTLDEWIVITERRYEKYWEEHGAL
jgi:calcineurin-like phosphoesterase family protein